MINIVCPGVTATGGTEALHQLGNELVRQGKEVQMVYTGDYKSPVADRFEKYAVPWIQIEDFVDREEDSVVVPEIYVNSICGFSGKVYVWWLSVDNAPQMTDEEWRKEKYTHLAQSQYALDWLVAHDIKNVAWLSDYINDEFFEDVDVEREDLIIFNPSKGYNNTARIIKEIGGVKWMALKDMSPRELRDAMHRAKVYIDLGQCPGKDRMPREAVICGCNIITSRLGGFKNSVDTNIPYVFKVDTLDDAVTQTRRALECYSELKHNFDANRVKIYAEKAEFQKDVERIFW